MKTTWRKLITDALMDGDNFEDLAITLTQKELDVEFNDSYGGSEGKPFTAWSRNWVYFPVVYDGAEWVGSVPRNPCNIATYHKGGE